MSVDRKDRYQLVEHIRRDMLRILNDKRGARSRKTIDTSLQKLAAKWRQAVGSEFINSLSSCVLRDMSDGGRYYVKLTFSRVYEQASLVSLFGNNLKEADLDALLDRQALSKTKSPQPDWDEDRPTEPRPKDHRRSSFRPITKLSLLKGGKGEKS